MDTTTKTCSACRVLLPMSSFYKNSSSKDKLSYRCKSCDFKASSKSREKNIEKRKEKQREYSRLNKEAATLRMRKWREENKDASEQYSKTYYLDNRTKILSVSKLRYEKNKDGHLKRNKEWRLNNLDKDKASKKKYYQENKSKFYFRNRVREGVQRQATPKWLSKAQKEHIESMYFFRRAVSGVVGGEYHVDHIVPLQGENVCGLHVPWNLQVISAKDNLSKSNSVDHLDTF